MRKVTPVVGCASQKVCAAAATLKHNRGTVTSHTYSNLSNRDWIKSKDGMHIFFFCLFFLLSTVKQKKKKRWNIFWGSVTFPAALAPFSTVWTFLQLWPSRSARMAKRNNDVLCLGREDIIVAYYVTVFSLLSCYQTANCTALILWENFTINPANFLIISAHITSLFRAICRYASSDGGLMWLYLKTSLKVLSKHAKSKSIYTYSEWLGAIEWDEVWCKSSCWKNIAALREESFISKKFTVSCSASRTKKKKLSKSWANAMFKSCILSHLLTSGLFR